MAERKVTVILAGDAAGMKKAFADGERSASGFGSKLGGLIKPFGDVAKIASGFVVGQGLIKMGGFLRDAAQGAAEDAQAQERLNQAVKNTGYAWEDYTNVFDEVIDAGQKKAFTDDQIRDSLVTLLNSTGDVTEAEKRHALALDLSRGAGIDLNTASRLLGKVTEENVKVFTRMGITLREGATEADVLAEIQKRFAGQADAYAQSTAGQFEQTKIRMGELKEQIGTALLPIMTKIGTVLLEDVVPKLEQFAGYWAANIQPRIEAFLEWLGPQLTKVGEFISAEVIPRLQEFAAWWSEEIQPRIEEFVAWAIPRLQELGQWVATEFAKFKVYYESDIKPALDNIQKGVEEVIAFVREHWPEIERVVRPVLEQVVLLIETAVNTIKLRLGIIIDLLGGDWAGAWDKTKALLAGVVTYWKETLQNYVEFTKGLLPILLQLGKDLIGRILEGLQHSAIYLAMKAKELGDDLVKGIWNGLGDVWQIGADIIHWLWQGMVDMAWKAIDKAKSIAGEIGAALNPKNWFGSPKGIQNWFPYYFDLGMQNLAAVANNNPHLAAALGHMKASFVQMAEVAADSGSAAGLAWAAAFNKATAGAIIGPGGQVIPGASPGSGGSSISPGSFPTPGSAQIGTINGVLSVWDAGLGKWVPVNDIPTGSIMDPGTNQFPGGTVSSPSLPPLPGGYEWVFSGGQWVAMPSFDGGIESVPRDMIAKVHKGEKIVPADRNQRGGITVVNNFNGPITTAKKEVARLGESTGHAIVSAVRARGMAV